MVNTREALGIISIIQVPCFTNGKSKTQRSWVASSRCKLKWVRDSAQENLARCEMVTSEFSRHFLWHLMKAFCFSRFWIFACQQQRKWCKRSGRVDWYTPWHVTTGQPKVASNTLWPRPCLEGPSAASGPHSSHSPISSQLELLPQGDFPLLLPR